MPSIEEWDIEKAEWVHLHRDQPDQLRREPADLSANVDVYRRQRILAIQQYLNLNITLEAYESRYGRLLPQTPWGDELWSGLRSQFELYRHRPHVDVAARPIHFLLNSDFSKSVAKQPRRANAIPKPYAAWAWPHHAGTEWAFVACQWMLEVNSRPWCVHKDWVIYF